tara:strand:+ start:193 stop:336 length:144 start_codon:yes stop_codon:yes gene_type:complete
MCVNCEILEEKIYYDKLEKRRLNKIIKDNIKDMKKIKKILIKLKIIK